jgi:hypothetical protein
MIPHIKVICIQIVIIFYLIKFIVVTKIFVFSYKTTAIVTLS